MTGRIAALYRHPVKGLTPEPLNAAALTADGHFPCDRIYAVEDGPSGFDPAAPIHLSKQKFAVLAKQAELARVRAVYDEVTGVLRAQAPSQPAFSGDLTAPQGRAAFAAWLQAVLGEAAWGPLKVLAAPPGHRFMDSRKGFVSVLNLASVQALADRTGRPVDPLRFRANIHVAGWPAWAELGSGGRRLVLGEVELQVLDDIDRCAATEVNPATGERDMDTVRALFAEFGHILCGVYARVTRGGPVRLDDAAELDA